MLTLIDSSNIPEIHGIAKINPSIGELILLWTISIMWVIPAANKAENINEYPIKWTDSDCWKIAIKNNKQNIKGRNVFKAGWEFLIKKYIPVIEIKDKAVIPINENKQL